MGIADSFLRHLMRPMVARANVPSCARPHLPWTRMYHGIRGRPMLELEFQPVVPDRLSDLAHFSECHGKFRYCSCMRWRMTSAEFQRFTKQDRVDALDDLVRQNVPVG